MTGLVAGRPFIWRMLVTAVAVVVAMFAVRRERDMLPFIAAFFLYFSFGQVVNHLRGDPIYPGIATELIGPATAGSVLFADTFVMRLFPDALPFRWGATYVDGLVKLLPLRIGPAAVAVRLAGVRVRAGKWFRFGFSLAGEAYLNFGLAGIPAVFLLLTAAHRCRALRGRSRDVRPEADRWSAAPYRQRRGPCRRRPRGDPALRLAPRPGDAARDYAAPDLPVTGSRRPDDRMQDRHVSSASGAVYLSCSQSRLSRSWMGSGVHGHRNIPASASNGERCRRARR
jgi:hypothetical protein